MKKAAIRMAAMILVLAAMVAAAMPAMAVPSVFQPSESYAEGEYYQKLLDVEFTGDPRQDVINIALSQVGYIEGGKSGDYSGYSRVCNNFSEYGHAMGNGGAIWCTSFIWWCVRQAGLDASVFPDTIWPRLLTVNCPYAGYTPSAPIQPGDILFIENSDDDTPDHLGLVTQVTDTTITCVEGNCGNRVFMVNYDRAMGMRTDGQCDILYIGYINYERDPAVPDASSLLRYALITSDAPLYNKHTGGDHQGTGAVGTVCPLLEIRGDAEWVQIEYEGLAYWTDPDCVYTGSMDEVLEKLVAMTEPAPTTASQVTAQTEVTMPSDAVQPGESTSPSTTAAPTTAQHAGTQHGGQSVSPVDAELAVLAAALGVIAILFVVLLVRLFRRSR